MSQSARLNMGLPQAKAAAEATTNEIIKLVYDLTGNRLTDEHKGMITSRLYGRQLELGLESLEEYLTYFKANSTVETPQLIALLTTHHTYFFREYSHFEYLISTALPQLIPLARKRANKTIRIWSAACSRGQEAYSLAMCLDYFLKTHAPDISFEVYGTDIDAESVRIAQNGVYPKQETQSIPLQFLAGHVAKGTGDIAEFSKVKSSIKKYCKFAPGNLLDAKMYQGLAPFDIIFCRNVFIYFEKPQIKTITQKILGALAPEGYFFIGVSESLNGLELPVQKSGASIFRHAGLATAKAAGQDSTTTKIQPAKQTAPIRVLCVDDSSTIHTLLKKILSKDYGYEIVGTALNGVEAAKKLAELKGQVDVMTLDIHMPEMTGVEYMAKHFDSKHPPVVMVSSVSRDDSELALKSLKLGASDFVEKPTVSNLMERAEEIRAKIKTSVWSRSQINPTHKLDYDESIAKKLKIVSPESKQILILSSYAQKDRLTLVLKELGSLGPNITVLLDTQASLFEAKSKEIMDSVGADRKKCQAVAFNQGASLDEVARSLKSHNVLLVLGAWTPKVYQKIRSLPNTFVVLEDLPGSNIEERKALPMAAHVPATSFAYTALEELCRKK